MTRMQYAARIGAAALLVSASTACSSALGNVFGNVLGNGSQDMSGTVQGVDTRSQQIFLQQSNGQTVGVTYDSRTQVVYNNQTYSVNSLERGDQVTVRITNSSNNGNTYYTDYVRVDQAVAKQHVVDAGDHWREELVLHSHENVEIFGYLLRPKTVQAPNPTILALHGHGNRRRFHRGTPSGTSLVWDSVSSRK